MDTVFALLVVALAAAYLARRAWRTLTGSSCGCASSSAGRGCPAAAGLAEELELLVRDSH